MEAGDLMQTLPFDDPSRKENQVRHHRLDGVAHEYLASSKTLDAIWSRDAADLSGSQAGRGGLTDKLARFLLRGAAGVRFGFFSGRHFQRRASAQDSDDRGNRIFGSTSLPNQATRCLKTVQGQISGAE